MLTVFTIAYNGYGKFLNKWVENAKQSNADKIIVVLGKEHGADIKYLKSQDVKVIESDSEVMGTLRNLAIDESDTEWLLYFSADDELLPNAKDEIINKSKYDVVCLKYIEVSTNGVECERKSASFNKTDLRNWRKNTIPGYIAFKREINGVTVRYEDIEIPNYPMLFYLASIDAKFVNTKDVCARYIRRPKSHGYNSARNGKWQEFTKTLDESARKYEYKKEVIKPIDKLRGLK